MEKLIRKYHKPQLRNNMEGYLPPKVPYVDHLFGVESILSFALRKFGECADATLRKDMCRAALGHDLLEDTGVTEDEIISAANSRVLEFIKELTNVVDDTHTDQYMQQLSSASEEARLIKYSDLIEHTSSVCYNFHILGEKWVHEFYRPIMYDTLKALNKTEFIKYPQTAGYMRCVLAMLVDLLNVKYRGNPQQYTVKVIQAVREVIPETELNEHIKKSHTSFYRINKSYCLGYMTPEERYRIFQGELYNGFYKYLESKQLHFQFTEKNWSRFLEDYSLLHEKNEPVSQAGGPWLCYDDCTEASVLDKVSFFRLMDAFLIPTEYFKPIYANCIKPRIRIKPYSNSTVGIIEFHLASDGGLFSEGNVIGKTFILVDKNGLKAELKIIRDVSEEKNRHHNIFTAKYSGYGTIEGYTSARKREIDVSNISDDDIWLYTHLDNDDADASKNFPLWAEYNELSCKFRKLQDEHLKKLIDHFEGPFCYAKA